MLRKALVAALFVILPACVHAGPVVPDFTGYQSLLDQYVVRISARGEPLDTRFDYEQLYVDEKIWTKHHSDRLDALHAQMLDATPSRMTPAQRHAWAINTYNFLVIERVTNGLLIPNRLFVRVKKVDEIGMRGVPFFTSTAAVVEGRRCSLADFERHFVFEDTTTADSPRAPLNDPRILFAINPGRIGLPPLMPRAFRPESLDRQLDEATRTALALPRFVTFKASPAGLFLSNFLGRNRGDFGGEQGLIEFVLKYLPRETRNGIRSSGLKGVTRYQEVNPLLNQKDHPKIFMPAAPESSSVAR